MAATIFGVIVSAGNNVVRRYVFPDRNGDLKKHLGPGEVLVKIKNQAGLGQPARPEDQQLLTSLVSSDRFQQAVVDAIVAATGRAPGDPRCAVIDASNVVVNVVMADPAIDSIPGMTLVQSSSASTGDAYDRATGTFASPADAG